MFRQFLMWAFICATAPAMYSNNIESPATETDSTEYSISPLILDEITVKATPVINKTDRMLIRPDKEILRTSADGMDLLRRLHLSRIRIDPMTNAVTVTGGGDAVLCINGIEATASQIAAVRPQDIIRIEYHDNPGVRYAGARAVIDYITVRHDDGGVLSFDTFTAVEDGRWATIDHIAGQYDRNRSVFSVNAGYMGQHKDQWIRDYNETWHYPGHTVARQEKGMPVTVGQSGFESTLNYNYLHPSGNMFNVRIGIDLNDVPNQEEGDRYSILNTSYSEIPILVTEHTEERSVSPDIGFYYLHKLSDCRSFMIDAQGSYMHSHMLHEYSEDNATETNRVKGNKYSWKVLGMYEKRSGNMVWSLGLSDSRSAIGNTYHQTIPAIIKITSSETALAGEYSNRLGNWSLMGNLRAAYRHIGHTGENIDKVFVLPAATITCKPLSSLFLRYTASLDYTMPSAAEISNVSQPIQSGLIRRGNQGLQPFRVTEQSFDASFESEYVSVNPRIEYRNEHKPIMESVLFEDGLFVRTFFNQRSFQRLSIGGSFSVRPWKNHITVTASPQLMRYFSHGIDYRHCHNIFRLGLSMDFNFKDWLVYANIMSGPANNMYGEEIIEEKNMNQIMAGYRHGSWSLHLGIFNAFLKNYWMESRNLSALAPYISKAHSGRSSSYIAVKFNMSIDFGRGSRNVELHKKEIDDDNGILSGTK